MALNRLASVADRDRSQEHHRRLGVGPDGLLARLGKISFPARGVSKIVFLDRLPAGPGERGACRIPKAPLPPGRRGLASDLLNARFRASDFVSLFGRSADAGDL